ncbi:MAG: hypothetical protein Q4B57_08915 [Eubacteriales bacterium]|nr:hypothetical protein [Eubacteriales bacterium]
MGDARNDMKILIWAILEGLMAPLMLFSPIVKASAIGVSAQLTIFDMISSVLGIKGASWIGVVEGEDRMILLFYIMVLLALIALSVYMALRLYKCRGRILYLVGNGLIFALIMMVDMTISGNSLGLGNVGFGYQMSLYISAAGFIMAILNMIYKWTYSRKELSKRKSSAGRSIDISGMREHIKRSGAEAVSRMKHSDFEDERHIARPGSHIARPESHVARPVSYAARPVSHMEESTRKPEEHPDVSSMDEAVKVKYNMGNQKKQSSEFFHTDTDDLA